MERNQAIKVYNKPITDEDFEGNARLYRHHPSEDDPELGQRWTVAFDDVMFVDRWVHPRNLID